MNFKDLFLEHCKKNKFNINQNQIKVIEQLESYHNKNFKNSLLKKIFKKNSDELGFYLFGFYRYQKAKTSFQRIYD